MIRLPFPPVPGATCRVLAIGAHADDIEIGAGGTILRLLEEGARLDVTWVVLCASGARGDEARASAEAFLAGAEASRVVLGDFRDGYLPHTGGEVKDFFEGELKQVGPELVLTHRRDDLHQDHRLACELTWNTFRDHLVLEYEIPKWDGDLGVPNVFAPLPAPVFARKQALLREHFATQHGKDWFADDVFAAVARIRGMECRAPSGYAEAFTCRKLAI